MNRNKSFRKGAAKIIVNILKTTERRDKINIICIAGENVKTIVIITVLLIIILGAVFLIVKTVSGRIAKKNYVPPVAGKKELLPPPPAVVFPADSRESLCFCSECGTVNDRNAENCSKCGKKL